MYVLSQLCMFGWMWNGVSVNVIVAILQLFKWVCYWMQALLEEWIATRNFGDKCLLQVLGRVFLNRCCSLVWWLKEMHDIEPLSILKPIIFKTYSCILVLISRHCIVTSGYGELFWWHYYIAEWTVECLLSIVSFFSFSPLCGKCLEFYLIEFSSYLLLFK